MTPSKAVLAVAAVAVVAVGLAPHLADAVRAQANGPVLYVSPTGADTNPGTQAAPLRTPQAAVTKLPAAGGTVELAGGTYAKQRIVLADRHDITVRAASGARPVLDATGLVPADDRSGVVQIANSSSITVTGLRVTGYRTTSLAKVPIGIYVTGAGRGIDVTGNHVDTLGNDNTTKGSGDINAHGIAVYGDNAKSSLADVHIDGNEVDHLKLGASEAVVVNGNVDGWSVTGNSVHDNNNIGIDAIGYEDVITGTARYTDANRARNGVISNNTVARISAVGNPAYYDTDEKAYCRCADGVYVDGGAAITIADNTVTTSDIGIEVASENPKGKTNGITVRGNIVTGSGYVAMTMGGYAGNRGEAYDLTVTGNTLTGSGGDGSPVLLLQYKVHDTTITGNKVTATDADDAQLVQRVAKAGTATQNQKLVLDGNDYGAPVVAADAGFAWLGKPVAGFAAWQRTSAQDAHSTYTRR